jgi:beta-lactamase regulating signal transducer with metallopeptidase domain
MTVINDMLQQPVARAIGWALLQFVWQGALVGLVTAALLAALRRSAADVRYVISSIALSVMFTIPAVTAVQMLSSPTEIPDRTTFTASATVGNRETLAPPSAALSPVDAARGDGPLAGWRVDIEGWLPILVSAWLAGVAILTLRLMSGWMWVRRMRSHGTVPAGELIDRLAHSLIRRLHIDRTVRFLQSSLVEVPTVVGWLKPVVLLPISAVAGLSPRQLEAVLAHELAHIRRHDYLVNLLQTLVETLLFYHPAVWWVSKQIRIERENCCDDLAVSLCGNPVAYAAALAELEGLRDVERRLALAATGGSLLDRVRRLLGAPSHAGRAPGWLAAGVAVMVVVGISASAVGRDGRDRETINVDGALVQEPFDQSVSTPRPASDVRASTASQEPAAPVATTPVATTAVAAGAAQAAVARAVEAVQAASTRTSTAVAAATDGQTTRTSRDDQKSGNFIWSNNGERLEVKYRGDIEFTDDDTDVRSITPGGWLTITDSGRTVDEHTVEFRSRSDGTLERRFWIGRNERPFDAEGRKWLAQVLPRFIRQTGIGASSRVARILKSKGAPGVLAEIALIEGSWAKRLYFAEFFKTPALDARTVQQALEQAGRQIDSDFELASLLIASDHLVTDEGTRKAYFDAARTIESDFEMRRVFSSALKKGPVAPALLAGVLESSASIDSDFEEATLLIQVANLQPIDSTTRGPFFKALATVDSAFERRRVLTAVLDRSDLSSETLTNVLEASALVRSDFERAAVLLEFVKAHPIEGAARAPFFNAVSSIDSAFERGRVLQAVARSDASEETVLGIIRAARTMTSNFEKSQVLLAVARAHQLSRAARDAYIEAAENLGDFEQGRVLSALVKNER